MLVAVDSAAEPTVNVLIPAKAVEWGKLPHVLAACAVVEALWFNTNDEDPTVTVQYMYELSTLSICTCVPGVYNRYMYASCGCMGVPACGLYLTRLIIMCIVIILCLLLCNQLTYVLTDHIISLMERSTPFPFPATILTCECEYITNL